MAYVLDIVLEFQRGDLCNKETLGFEAGTKPATNVVNRRILKDIDVGEV